MADQLLGSAGNDTLLGGVGNDTLDGGADADTLYGEEGNDTLEGGSGNDVLYGDQASGAITGDDTLRGGAGKDVLYGGAGNDIYRFGRGDGNDRIIESSGVDKIKLEPGIVPANVTLFRNNFDLILALDAGATQISVAGYFGADTNARIETIEFNDGTIWNQTMIQSLTVAGTANAMTGTAGNDTFVVDNVGDMITEGANQGTDTVQSSVGYTLGANVENLTLTGYLNVDATGNALDNTLLGNIGDNTLDGLAGSDVLTGGKGDDVYRADSNDTVTELAGEGNDTVVYTGGGNSYTLTDNVENISVDELYGYSFTTTLTGNALDNVIDGSGGYIYRGGTILDGGLGADIMIGRTNVADTYFVDNVGDVVIEFSRLGENTGDLVNSTISYTLSSKIENLALLGSSGISGTGNASNNILDGSQNAAANTLTGAQGNDTYLVQTNDVIVEAANEGDDLVKAYSLQLTAYSSYTLSNNLETLWLYGGGTGVGNDQNNIIQNRSFDYATVLDGRGGDDLLIGIGNTFDTYAFDRGYGHDIAQSAVVSTVLLGPNTSAADVRLAMQGADLIVSYPDTTDTLTLRNFSASEFRFADGTIWNWAAVAQRLSSNNTNVLTAGNDIYGGTTSNDVIDGQAGDDILSGGQGSDTILGGDGVDSLYGNTGNDILNGGLGQDTVYGNAGDDDLESGTGGDNLHGGTGNDTYRFARGSGYVGVYEASNARADTDRILMGANINPADVSVTQSGATLNLTINGTSEGISIFDFFAQPLVDRGIRRQGDDLVIWMNAKPDQTLTVPGYFLTWAGGDPANDAVFTQDGYDLILGVTGFPQTTRVIDFYYGSEIEEIRFADGTVWTPAMLIAMTKIINGTDLADTLSGTFDDNRMYGFAGNDTLDGFEGNDLLDGGTGVDTMRGGAGNDRYVVDNTGDITTELASEGIDTIESSVTRTLGANFENLTLTGTTANNATGNTLNNILIGNSANNVLNGGAGADQMTGGAGDDTYIVDNIADVVTENAAEGIDLVQTTVNYTLGANVENLTITATTAVNGTGNALDNVLIGGSGDNILDGGAGNDTINGGAGVDTLKGGLGNDIYIVDTATDIITENLNEGTDTIQSSVTFTMAAAAYSNIENLTLTATTAINGTGNTLDNIIVGGGGNNILDGGAGNDTLEGGAGTDTLKGGLGNDIFIVDSITDVITENLSEGTDTVRSSVTYTTLAANVENLVLTGTAAINGTGNTLNNTLTGNSNNNTLNGGTGVDTLIGGAGNDIYVVDSTTDIITENLNEGTDTIQSSITFTIAAAAYNNLENLSLTATTAINGTGNALDNVLTGGSGNNILDGGAGNDTLNGGAGVDTLKGGLGNDTYAVDTTTDVITENLNEGTDTIQSSVTFTMAAAAYNNVENLTLAATTAINGTGNALDNVIIGGSGNNILDGGAGNDTLDGGVGTDTLKGGLGNDIMVVDATTDVVTENLNEGIDTVRTSVTLTATAANVEVLVLTGTTLINGTDNALNNLLTGNSNNNTLTATTGNDILQGDAGNDTLTDTTGGNNLFNGGAGADIINASSGKELFIGGAGNDTITTGTGADMIAFNRGDGQDVVNASTGADNTISLGWGIQYTDLYFKKNLNDLILDVGATEQITLKDWYLGTTNKSVLNLQMIAEAMADFNATGGDPIRNSKVETFNFASLANSFDLARAATPTLTSWALTNALLTFHNGDSDTAALGGDLAYQ